ncbi:hypothetical protein [Desulfobacter curvatus]|uniref:COG4705 family protein n=1 Tax=Desulfobacter curvatus TaxID=2290 RepID=UPI000364EE5B|nr:hypothetical protein [Desulfobacter curvatus]
MNSLEKKQLGQLLSKVPEVTIYFWVIKVLCTTVGETAADFLNMGLGFGLGGTSAVMGVLLTIVLVFQYRAPKYVPGIYWLTVVLISIFGTLVTDLLTDALQVPLETSTLFFSAALAVTFAVWYGFEKTLSIHSIFTARRESFYWIAILFTFALGTATGDLMAEGLGLGYLVTGILVCCLVFVISVAWKSGLDSILSFWIIYIMTRPLGACLGDYMSQSTANGGLDLGPTLTSAIFLSAILFTVIFLTITKRDMIVKNDDGDKKVNSSPRTVFAQVVVVLSSLVFICWGGYHWLRAGLQISTTAEATQALGQTSASDLRPLGDLSPFKTITVATLELVDSGNLSAAKTKVRDLETAWDNAAGALKRMNKEKWAEVDDAIDTVLRQLRAFHQDSVACQESLHSLLTVIDTLNSTPSQIKGGHAHG